MAKISSESIGFAGRAFQRVVTVNSEGIFSCALPEEVCESLGYSHVTGATKNEVLTKWSDALKTFSQSNTTKRKVILYWIARTGNIWQGDQCVLNASQANGEGERISFAKGLALSVAASVYEESAIAQPNALRPVRYLYTRLPSSIPRSLSTREVEPCHGDRANYLLEWTQEREDFFCKLGIALERIVLELEKLKTPDALLEVIASGGLFKQIGAPK